MFLLSCVANERLYPKTMPGYWDHSAWSLLAHTLRDRPTFQSTLLNLHVEIKHVHCLSSDPITGGLETNLARMQTKASKRSSECLPLALVTCPTASALIQRVLGPDDSDSACLCVSFKASNDLNHLQIQRDASEIISRVEAGVTQSPQLVKLQG